MTYTDWGRTFYALTASVICLVPYFVAVAVWQWREGRKQPGEDTQPMDPGEVYAGEVYAGERSIQMFGHDLEPQIRQMLEGRDEGHA
jgi:hypothetical protein